MDINRTKLANSGCKFLSQVRFEIVSDEFDYVLDCIDGITPKLNLIITAQSEKSKNNPVLWALAENGA
jgi:tRNA A37 threonylcarbamoyladenosine dehydratase